MDVDAPRTNGMKVPVNHDGVHPDGELPQAKNRKLVIGKRLQAIRLLVLGHSVTEVADKLNVDRSTVHRWLIDPDFQQELAKRQGELTDKTLGLYAYASLQAIRKLVEMLDEDDERIVYLVARLLVPTMGRVSVTHERRIRRLEDEAEDRARWFDGPTRP
jgi:hypothetical protein